MFLINSLPRHADAVNDMNIFFSGRQIIKERAAQNTYNMDLEQIIVISDTTKYLQFRGPSMNSKRCNLQYIYYN